MKKIIIIVVGVLVLLLGGGAGVYFLKPDLLPGAIRPTTKMPRMPTQRARKKKQAGKQGQREKGRQKR